VAVVVGNGFSHHTYYFCKRDNSYRLFKLKVPGVFQLQIEDITASSAPTTYGHLMETQGTDPGKSHMPQVTSHHGSSHMRKDSRKPQIHTHIASLLPGAAPDSFPMKKSKPGEPISLFPSI
jgi:hypothetical protein